MRYLAFVGGSAGVIATEKKQIILYLSGYCNAWRPHALLVREACKETLNWLGYLICFHTVAFIMIATYWN